MLKRRSSIGSSAINLDFLDAENSNNASNREREKQLQVSKPNFLHVNTVSTTPHSSRVILGERSVNTPTVTSVSSAPLKHSASGKQQQQGGNGRPAALPSASAAKKRKREEREREEAAAQWKNSFIAIHNDSMQELASEKQQVEKDLDIAQRHSRAQQREIGSLNEEVVEVEKKLAFSETQLEGSMQNLLRQDADAVVERKRHQAQLEGVQLALEEAASGKESLQMRVESLLQEQHNMQNAVRDVQGTCEQYQAEIAQLAQEKQTLLAGGEASVKQLEMLGASLASTTAALAQERSKLGKLQKMFLVCLALLQNHSAQRNGVTEQHTQLSHRLSQAKADMLRLSQECQIYQNKLKQRDTAVVDLEFKFQDMQHKFQTSQASVAAQHEYIEELQDTTNNQQNQIVEVTSERNELIVQLQEFMDAKTICMPPVGSPVCTPVIQRSCSLTAAPMEVAQVAAYSSELQEKWLSEQENLWLGGSVESVERGVGVVLQSVGSAFSSCFSTWLRPYLQESQESFMSSSAMRNYEVVPAHNSEETDTFVITGAPASPACAPRVVIMQGTPMLFTPKSKRRKTSAKTPILLSPYQA